MVSGDDDNFLVSDEENPFSDSYDPVAHGIDPLSAEWLHLRQLTDLTKAGTGFLVRNLDTGEVVEIIEPRVTPETKASAGEAGLN